MPTPPRTLVKYEKATTGSMAFKAFQYFTALKEEHPDLFARGKRVREIVAACLGPSQNTLRRLADAYQYETDPGAFESAGEESEEEEEEETWQSRSRIMKKFPDLIDDCRVDIKKVNSADPPRVCTVGHALRGIKDSDRQPEQKIYGGKYDKVRCPRPAPCCCCCY